MTRWKAVGRVFAGTFTTVWLSIVTVVLLPFLGFATAELVGDWLPVWIFAVPVALCATAGGALTGLLHIGGPRDCTLLGGLAGALGFALIGVGLGLVALLIMLGMVPAGGRVSDFGMSALVMGAVGAGAGFIAGAVFGAIGGAGAHVIWRVFG